MIAPLVRARPWPPSAAFVPHNRVAVGHVPRLRALNGADTQVSDPAVSSYVGVHLWAAAVRELGSAQTEGVNANVLQQSVSAPHGYAAVDAQSRHLWRQLRIAQVRPDGQLVEVWQVPRPIRPAPWPAFRSTEHWAAVVARPGGRR